MSTDLCLLLSLVPFKKYIILINVRCEFMWFIMRYLFLQKILHKPPNHSNENIVNNHVAPKQIAFEKVISIGQPCTALWVYMTFRFKVCSHVL